MDKMPNSYLITLQEPDIITLNTGKRLFYRLPWRILFRGMDHDFFSAVSAANSRRNQIFQGKNQIKRQLENENNFAKQKFL